MQPHLTKQSNDLMAPGWFSGPGSALVRCWVKDITKQGATLVVQDKQPPDEFRLYFSPYASTYRMCAVQWRQDNGVGVQFVRGAPAQPAAVAPAAPT
jgi:hypothetical protein